MGWCGFDFGRVLHHLRALGVTKLTWDGENLTCEPSSDGVHPDVRVSLAKSNLEPFTMDLT